MLKKIYLFAVYVLIGSMNLDAQTFYFSTFKANDPDGGAEIGVLDISNCQSTIIGDQDFFFFSDISFSADSNLFVQHPIGSINNPPNQILEVLFNPTISPLFYYLGNSGNNEFIDNITALTCDTNGNFYGAGKGVSVYSGDFIPPTYLGDLPSSMEAQGDITYREGIFYLSSINNSLVQVDINNPSNSSVVFDFPVGTPPIHGLATVEIDCDSFITYASGITATGSIIYEVDFNAQTLNEICQLNKFILGLASISECFIPECSVIVSLDDNGSSGAIENNFEIGTVCETPIHITDDDVNISSETDYVDSIQIKITNSMYVGDYLDIQNPNSILVTGAGTSNLSLINNGTSSITDFETAISNIRYFNDALNFSSPVSIEVIAYTLDVESEPAISTILLGESSVTLEIDSISVNCFDGSDGELVVLPFNGIFPYTYDWNTNQNTDTISNLSAGSYSVTITDDLGCSALENNIILSEPNLLEVDILNIGFTAICNNSGQLEANGTGGTEPYNYLWNEGSTSNVIDGIPMGTYTVTLTDMNGCQAINEMSLGEGTSISIDENISLCEGDVYTLNNQNYTIDTTVCETYTLANGCDSIHCFQLEFINLITTTFNESICLGESFLWNGENLNTDTIIVNSYTLANGCDSLVNLTLSIQNISPIVFNTSGSLCDNGQVEISVNQYDSYEWSTGTTNSNIIVDNEGIYSITITNGNCSIQDEIQILQDELEIQYMVTSPFCFGDTNGSIQIENVIGGTEPYLFSINNEPYQSTPLYENLGSGLYSLFVEDANGCIQSAMVAIDSPQELTIQTQDSYDIKLGEEIDIQLVTNINQSSVVWSPPTYLDCDSCLNVISKPLTSIIYDVIVLDANGCFIEKNIRITVDDSIDVYIPNAFTPNDDGVNDFFKVYGGSSISKVKSFRIFNRWGALVYKEEAFFPGLNMIGWDGRFKDQNVQIGVYVYTAEIEQINGEVYRVSGEVTLTR